MSLAEGIWAGVRVALADGQRGEVRNLYHNTMGDVADVLMDTVQKDGTRWRTVRVRNLRPLNLIEAIGELS